MLPLHRSRLVRSAINIVGRTQFLLPPSRLTSSALRPSSARNLRSLSSAIRSRSSPLLPRATTPRVSSFGPRQFKRACSCRNMCRSMGDDTAGGAASIAAGREILPTNVRPLHYNLSLEPDFKTFTYDGTVIIDLDVVEPTSSITLNALDLKVDSATLMWGDESELLAHSIKTDIEKQTVTSTFGLELAAGSKVRLKHTFSGKLTDNMAGFYRCSYQDTNGNTKYIASTQMEPTDARRAFPCFDEPALKAEFTVTLIADKKMTCLSNMDVALEKEVSSEMSDELRKAVTFNRSPRMSTYLLAFIVGELDHIETNSFRVPIRVYATPDQNIQHGKFSLELAARTLEFYEKAFDSKFPLPKMDMVAIPDFAAGAMENWGLITYRIVDVLYDEETTGASTKERIAETVQHELAHQWFGNLVTMDFWDGLWLNEGFATWMSWYSCNKFFPEWNVWQSYVVNDLQSALALDALRSSHPIEVPVKRADEINQIFDAISYSKGSAVLRMISMYMGEEKFLEGIRLYLRKHAYGNTTTSDLWAALSEVSGKPIESVMEVWTKKVGYPVITVEEKPEAKAISVQQHRYLRTADVKPEEDSTIYPVVLRLKNETSVDETVMLTERKQEIKVPDMDFFKLNADHSSLFRTCYSPARLEKLGKDAKAGLLSVEDRAGMIADAGVLASSGHQTTSGSLSLLKSFDNESEFVVWNQIISQLGSIRSSWVFEDSQVKDALKAFQRNLSSAKAHELGWEFSETDGHVLQQFKAMMFGTAGAAGDQKIIDAAKEMFRNFADGDYTAIHPNLRASVFDLVLRNGGEKEYNIIFDRYKKASTSTEKNTALRSLGSAQQPELIQRTLKLALSDEVRAQDIYMPLSSLRVHTAGITARWEWLKKDWDAVVKRLPPAFSMLGTVIQMCTGSLTTYEQLKDVEDFFKDKETKGFDRSLEQALDSIRAKAGWVQRDRQEVAAWLKTNGYLNSKL